VLLTDPARARNELVSSEFNQSTVMDYWVPLTSL